MAVKKEALGLLEIEGAKIAFRNFAGRPDQYNREGDRNFVVVLEDLEAAEKMIKDGWNLKRGKPDPDDDQYVPPYFLKVTVKYGDFPPKITVVSSRNQTILNERTVESLDYAEITDIDLIISPYSWTISGKSGITAYLKTMYVTIQEDRFAHKYDQSAMQERE